MCTRHPSFDLPRLVGPKSCDALGTAEMFQGYPPPIAATGKPDPLNRPRAVRQAQSTMAILSGKVGLGVPGSLVGDVSIDPKGPTDVCLPPHSG
ncbi:hypothetical protein AB0H43_22165 [Hamadaea sp. NPDC050747]|uniref:hypothetical protein n=1 Tax=Hamadaea sp. NPDC050747 TaxID=3155789 RepID=UPI0033DDD9D9